MVLLYLLVLQLLGVVRFGIFEANALRFGTDQLPDSSSEQLSAYVHWYYRTTQVGPLVVACICDVILILACHFQQFCHANRLFYLLISIANLIQLGMASIALVGLCMLKGFLELHI